MGEIMGFQVLARYILRSMSILLPLMVVGSTAHAEFFADGFKKVILDGNEAEENDPRAPFTVFIEILDKNKIPMESCTGVIIEKDVIMTAGHCFDRPHTTARVYFGYKSKFDFISSRDSLDVKTWRRQEYSGPGSGAADVVDQKDFDLKYTQKDQDNFYAKANSRTEWLNFFGSDIMNESSFYDLALIKIKSIPAGFRAIDLYRGTPAFKTPVYAAGYGRNSRINKENVKKLRWTELLLIGYYSMGEDYGISGYQAYSPLMKNICFGDSGGPIVIQQGNELKLIGITARVYNNCANSAIMTSPAHHAEKIRAAIVDFRSQRSL
jgi:hypothetical protein